MGKKELQDELLAVMNKHGLKAGDDESESEGAEGGAEAGDAAEKPADAEGSSTEAAEGDKGQSAAVVADLADSIAKKLTDAIAKNTGVTEADKPGLRRTVEDDIRTKVFTNYHGLKEITYPSDLGSLSKDEKIVNFFKALIYEKSDPASAQVLRALVEGTDSEGGYLVPEELRTEVFRILPDMVIMRNIARVLPMSTDTLKLNSLTARPVAYWTSEYASKSTTSAEFGQVSLSPNDLVCLLPISDQLLADANISLVPFIIELFAEAIGAGEDKAFFTGTGTGQPRGISIETINTVAAGGNLSFDNVVALIDQIPTRATQSPRAAFVGHRHVKSILRTLKDNNNNYIWRDLGTAPGGGTESRRLPSTVYGYPFHEQNDLDQSQLYFADWSYYIIGDRQAVSVRTTTEGGDAWRRNAMEIKAVERVDGRAVVLSPFAKITGI